MKNKINKINSIVWVNLNFIKLKIKSDKKKYR